MSKTIKNGSFNVHGDLYSAEYTMQIACAASHMP